MANFHFISLLFVTVLVASANAQTLIFGICRLPYSDPPERLVGFLAMVDRVNREGLIPGYSLSTEVYNYPYCNQTTRQCNVTQSAKNSGLAPFIGNFSRYHAILFANILISDVIIDAAKVAGIPLLDPSTIRAGDSNTSGLFLFEPSVETEITMIIRYMYMSHSCARTGVVYESINNDVAGYAQLVRESIAFGGYPDPPILLVSQASQAGIQDIFFGDPHRECLIFLTSAVTFRQILTTVSSDARFIAGKMHLFGWSHISAASVGTATFNPAILNNLYFPKNAPPLLDDIHIANGYRASLEQWVLGGGPTRDQGYFLPGDAIGTTVVASGFLWYTRGMYAATLFGKISQNMDLSNTTSAWAAVTAAARAYIVEVDDYPYFPPITKCRDIPFPQTSCSCSVVTRTDYFTAVNATGGLYSVYDRPQLGETNTAQISYPQDTCHMTKSISNYPFRALSLRTFGPSPSDAPYNRLAQAGHDDVEDLFFKCVVGQNLAETAPIRPWRLVSAAYPIDAITNNTAAQLALDDLIQAYDPFVVLATVLPVNKSSVLTLFPNMGTDELNDQPLKSREDGWDEKTLQLPPPSADYIHAMAAYLSDRRTSYSSLFVLTSVSEEASMVVKSFQTFQMEGPVESFVSEAGLEWIATIRRWASKGGAKPFIFVTTRSPDLCAIAYTLAAELGDVTFGLGVPEGAGEGGIALANITTLPSTADVLFGSYLSEFWTPRNAYTGMLSDLGMPASYINSVSFIKMVALFGAAISLSQQTLNQQRPAADVLYTSQTISVADIPMGPFYNDTCTQEQIAANDPDRTCQCKKGIRTIRVHSYFNRQQRRLSLRTGRYSYTQHGCGVEYKYFPQSNNNSDRAMLIIAVAATGSFLLLVCGTVVVIFACCRGRNNSRAPKDPSRPFSIVFTDIQSSTTLWSRCPATMSEAVDSHCKAVRKLIAAYNGYEVKTIGDSFMVAFHGPEAAVLFASKVQESLFDENWPQDLEQQYKEIILGQFTDHMRMSIVVTDDASNAHVADISCTEDRVPNVPDSEVEYARSWSGIRIRVGVHFGHGEIRIDPTSEGYDYFGTVVNTAARIEGVGHGGQTLVTGAVMEELGPNFANNNGLVQIDLGLQPLRGLESKVSVVQLLPRRVAGRRFPPLRLDVENDYAETDGTQHQSANSTEHINVEAQAQRCVQEYLTKKATIHAYGGESINEASQRSHPQDSHGASQDTLDLLHHYHFLLALFSTSTDHWKRDTLKHLTSRWRVQAPTASASSLQQALLNVSARAMNTTRQRPREPSLGVVHPSLPSETPR